MLDKAVYSHKMHLICMDVTKDEELQSAFNLVKQHLEARKEQLWAIVNNAAQFQCGFVEWGSISEINELFEVNIIGVIKTTRKFLPLLRESKGRVINVGTLVGHITLWGESYYCMTKRALVAFNEALRYEMKIFGVKVSIVEPTAVG